MPFITDIEEKHIRFLLDHSSPDHKEVGLEKLCLLYRKGCRLRNIYPVLQTLNGMLHDESPRVRRWALNAVAVVGTNDINGSAVTETIARDGSDPEILCAGIAALFSIAKEDKALLILQKKGIAVDGAILAASAQHSTFHRKLLAEQKINIEQASTLELKNAALLVGMDKAPANLFSMDHENSDVIGALNRHHDREVSQYSVWALVENGALGMGHLRLDVKDIESFPANVRKWMFQLMTKVAGVALQHREYILLGANDNTKEARIGLATGLKGIYFNGLEEITVDWISRERDEEVKALLFDHMASAAEQCLPYAGHVKDRYIANGHDSPERIRLEAAAQGTGLYSDLKRIALQQQNTFFGINPGGNTVVNLNITGDGNNVAGISGTGSVEIESFKAVNNIGNNPELKESLEGVLQFLKGSSLPPEQIEEGRKLVLAAAQKPSKSIIQQIMNFLGATRGIEAAVHLYDRFGGLLHTLPH